MASIVLSVCKSHGVSPDDFFGRARTAKIIACRREAINALRAAGFGVGGCARMMRRDISTISYWLKPHVREKRLKRMNARKTRLSDLVLVCPSSATIRHEMESA